MQSRKNTISTAAETWIPKVLAVLPLKNWTPLSLGLPQELSCPLLHTLFTFISGSQVTCPYPNCKGDWEYESYNFTLKTELSYVGNYPNIRRVSKMPYGYKLTVQNLYYIYSKHFTQHIYI